MVTSQRARIAAHNIDMCSFLDRNRSFIDVTQCIKLKTEELMDHIPSNVLVGLEAGEEMADWGDIRSHCFYDDENADVEEDGDVFFL